MRAENFAFVRARSSVTKYLKIIVTLEGIHMYNTDDDGKLNNDDDSDNDNDDDDDDDDDRK